MLRIGVLGAGNHSTTYHGPALDACRRNDEVTLAAVCDLDLERAQRYAERFGFDAVYTDWREMLERESLDGLVAVTPLDLTAELAGQLLPCGMPLLIEKPPGRSSDEARALLEAARQTGTPHMLSFNRRFSPAMVRAREWLDEHASEPARRVTARMLRKGRTEPDFVVGTGIHAVDTVLSLLGRPERVAPQGEGGGKEFGAEAAFPGGVAAEFVIAPVAGRHEETYEITGGKYCVHADVARCRVFIFDGVETTLFWQAPEEMGEAEQAGAVNETRAFLAALRGEGEFSPDLQTGLLDMLVAEAIQGRRDVEPSL